MAFGQWCVMPRFPFPPYQIHPVPSNSFEFGGSYPAFFVVTQAQTMNMSNSTISLTFTLSNSEDVVFKYGGQDVWNSGLPANARLFFGTVPGYHNQGTGSTNYWFNSQWVEIGTDTGTVTLTDSFHREDWSDAGGCADCPPVTDEDFWYAVANVREMGLSFGGGSFFDIGITTTAGSSILTVESFYGPWKKLGKNQ